jgi:hypothetical protein
MRRLALAAAVGAAVVGTAVPSLAQIGTPTQSVPVGTSNDNGKFCVWVSEQVPQCVDYSPVTDAIPGTFNVGPATVSVSTANGGVAVGTALGSQPLVGASVGNGQACAGLSEQVPVCVPTRAASKAAAPSVSGPVTVYHDDTRTAVGVRDIGVIVYNNGTICPVVSTQDWQCVWVQIG